MLPLFTANPKLVKSTAPAELVKGIADALRELGVPYAGVYFQFAHSDEKVLDRMVKEFPLLDQFRSSDASSLMTPGARLTNLALDADSNRLKPPMRATDELLDGLANVCRGVPRRFPVQHLSIIFAELQWGDGWLSVVPEQYVVSNDRMPPMFAAMQRFTSSITYSNMWWVSGRKQSLDIKLVGAPLSENANAPAVPARALELVGRFAKINSKSFTLLPLNPSAHFAPETTPFSEEKVRECASLTASAKTALAERIANQQLPFALAANLQEQIAAARETGVPKKEILAKALKPLGYKHSGKLGGQGVIGFEKTTKNHTRLTLEFDFGTWLPRFDVPTLQIAGASWGQLINVPFCEGIGSFAIVTRTDFEQAAANVASQLEELERSYIPALESLMGPSPAWTAASVRSSS